MDTEERSLEDTLSEAWDTVESTTENNEVVEESSFEGLADSGSEEVVEDQELVEGQEQAPAPIEAVGEEGEAATDTTPPPQSWNAQGREMWKELPKEAKDYILQREKQVAEGIEKHRQNADRAKAMDQTLAPYQQMFAMGGGPQPVIEGLLQTGAALSMGSPMQRAQTVANIIQRFGVEVPLLDSILEAAYSGKSPAQQGGVDSSHIQQVVQQAIAPYQQELQRIRQARQTMEQQTYQETEQELNSFKVDPKNEFFNDVRADMADIIEVAGRRGETLTLKEAYDRACYMNPQIRGIIQKRESSNNLATKRRAATSVAGAPAGPGGTQTPADLRSAIEQAWTQAGRG